MAGCYKLIARGWATLHELETVYSIDDIADALEMMDIMDKAEADARPE